MLMNSNHGLNCRNWCWIPLNIVLKATERNCEYDMKVAENHLYAACIVFWLRSEVVLLLFWDFSYVLFINAQWVWHMEVFTHRDKGSGESSARCVNQHAQCTSSIMEESEFYGAKTNCFVSVVCWQGSRFAVLLPQDLAPLRLQGGANDLNFTSGWVLHFQFIAERKIYQIPKHTVPMWPQKYLDT